MKVFVFDLLAYGEQLEHLKVGNELPYPLPNTRPGSPPFGFSTLTTSAPSQARASVQDGPASNCDKSSTRTPSRQFGATPTPSIPVTPVENRNRDDRVLRILIETSFRRS